MTLQTWEAAALPVSALALENREGSNDLELTQHALRKWEHMRASVLKRHGLHVTEDGEGDIEDEYGNRFTIGGHNCTLCIRHVDRKAQPGHRCDTCPLAKARNLVPCDRWDMKEAAPPWMAWTRNGDPELMILALKDTIAYIQANSRA